MPIDWTFLAGINLLQVAVVIVALYVTSRLLMRFWPWLRKVMDLTAALAQLPAFIQRTDASVAALRRQVENDHKTNLREELTTVLETTSSMSKQIEHLIKSDAAQWQVLDDAKPHAAKPGRVQTEQPKEQHV